MKKDDKIKHDDRRPVILWDSAEMITIYGAVAGIEAARGEIRLLFSNRIVHRERGEETIMVSDRVILSPFAAKRLHVLLGKIMARHQLPIVIGGNDLRAFMEASN